MVNFRAFEHSYFLVEWYSALARDPPSRISCHEIGSL